MDDWQLERVKRRPDFKTNQIVSHKLHERYLIQKKKGTLQLIFTKQLSAYSVIRK